MIDQQQLIEEHAIFIEFVVDFIKALQQTTYYTGDHPVAQKARHGLFYSFSQSLSDKAEISFIKRQLPDSSTILVDGLGEEPIDFSQIMRGEENKLYIPKFLDYFQRNNLFSFTLKKGLDKEGFYRFIDMISESPLSDGTVKEKDLEGLARQLQSEGIHKISVILDKESIGKGLQLPWRVEIALSRLHKDLQIVPLYTNASEEKLLEIKREVIADVIRPVRKPEAIRDILCYQDLITAGNPLLRELEIEQDLYLSLPPESIVLAISCGIPENLPKELSFEKIENRFKEAMKHALKQNLSIDEEVVEALNRCLKLKYMTPQQMPEKIKQRARISRLVEKYLEDTQVWEQQNQQLIDQGQAAAALRQMITLFSGLLVKNELPHVFSLLANYKKTINLVPQTIQDTLIVEKELLNDKKCWQHLYHGLEKLTAADKGQRLEFILLFAEQFELFIKNEIEKEEKLENYIFLLGAINSLDSLNINLYANLLKKFKEQRDFLLPTIASLGRSGLNDAAKQILPLLNHRRGSVRAESLEALFRIGRGQYKEQAIALLNDRKPRTVLTAVRFLGSIACKEKKVVQSLLKLLADNPEDDLQKTILENLSKIGNVDVGDNFTVEKALLQLISERAPEKSGFFKKSYHWNKEESKDYFKAISIIGGKTSLEQLKKMATLGPPAWQQACQEVIVKIEKYSTKK